MGSGWLLDVYAADEGMMVWWLDKRSGSRVAYRQPFTPTFYVAGAPELLRAAWRFLQQRPERLMLSRQVKRELHQGEIPLLAVGVGEPAALPRVAASVQRRFPQLGLYNVDVPLPLRYCAAFDLFPLCYAHFEVADDQIVEIAPKEDRWQRTPSAPPLRTLTIEPEGDPTQAEPRAIWVTDDRPRRRIPLAPAHLLLKQLQVIFRRFDPDLVLTRFGDSWLFPLLVRLSQQTAVPFHPSRDPKRPFLRRAARTIHSYGHVEHRHAQYHLYGRWHIDIRNSMMFGAYKVAGILEQTRVTSMPIQEVARKSPGAGITALQMVTALQNETLIPYEQQQVEYRKTAASLIQADRGGLVYQPLIGLHRHVVELDFASMYPSIMVAFNLSPETIRPRQGNEACFLPELEIAVDQQEEGFIPLTLRPLLTKRLALKRRLSQLHRWDCRVPELKARSSALKWLLVVCFGYQGFRHAKFGRVEAHEAITAYGREALLRAKEVAEERGYRVLHMYVDGLWVQRLDEEPPEEAEIEALSQEITRRTRLPIALEGVYDWIAFLPSRLDKRVPVANRYFGAFGDRRLKVRGVAAMRKDTAPFIVNTQLKLIELLAKGGRRETAVRRAVRFLQKQAEALRSGEVLLKELIITQRLSRELDAYRQPSPAARAARRLAAEGESVQAGERVRFVYVAGGNVCPWQQVAAGKTAVDRPRYVELLARAGSEVLEPFGLGEAEVTALVQGVGWQRPLPFR